MTHRRSLQLPVSLALSFSMLVLAGLILVLVASTAASSTASAASQQQSAPDVTSTLVINEVFRSSNPANDYMELYNGGTAPVDLSTYLIHNSSTTPQGTTYLSGLFTNTRILLPQNYVAISAAQFFSPTRTTLVGSGLLASDYLALATTANDTVPVDLVNWGDPLPSWYYFNFYQNYFFRPSPAVMPAPDGPNSLSRFPNGYDTDTAADWRQLPKSAGYANPSPTPGGATATPTAVGCEDRFEPDDTAQTAKVMEQNTEAVHTLCIANGTVKDRDWIQFTAVGGKQYTMLTKDLTGPVDTVMTLYDANLNTLAFNDDYAPGQGLSSRIDYTFGATGIYYLQIRDAKANGGLGFQYTVSIVSTGALPPTTTATVTPTTNPNATPTSGPCYDIYEPDGVPETAKLLLINTVQHHSVCPTADADWARFYVRAGKEYTIKTGTLGVGLDTYMYLFDSDAKTILAQNDDGGDSVASRIDFYPLRDDWYFVQVKNAGDIGGPEQTYDLSLTVQTGVPAQPGTATAIIAPVLTVTPGAPPAATKPPVPTPTQAGVPPTPTSKPTIAAIEPPATIAVRVEPTAATTPPGEVVIVPTEDVPGLPNTGGKSLPAQNKAGSVPQAPPVALSVAPINFKLFYDANSNKALDTGEGIRGVKVYFLNSDDLAAAEQAANLVTGNDGKGVLSLPLSAQRIYIPYLGINMPLKDFPARDARSLWLGAHKLPDRVP
ncbi:MAG: pre-peptidase C-terminal domain-containing protein [Chloroflexia bacterium]